MIKHWYRVRDNWSFDLAYRSRQSTSLYNLSFTTRYLLGMRQYVREPINVQTVEAALKRFFPESAILGDKWPHYMFLMDKFVNVDNVYGLVIYRDCRDVTSSFLKQARTTWRQQAWVNDLGTAENVARHWVEGIKVMERHAAQLHIIRYEELIDNPETIFAAIGDWLGVDSAGFPTHEIKRSSLGKYKGGLTNEELATVMDIAGPTMARLGYV